MMDKRVVIYQHAIDMLIAKVKGGDHKEASAEEMADAYERVLKTVRDPDRIHHAHKEKPQIHIKGDLAVPVGVETESSGSYLPYSDDDTKVVVPTSIRASKFDNNDREKAKA